MVPFVSITSFPAHPIESMRHDKLEKQLELLLLLIENRDMDVDRICERTAISRRTFYYYLEFYRDCGFVIEKRGRRYSIDRSSPFFAKLVDRISFTEDEAITIRQLLEQVDVRNAVVEGAKRKLDRFYDFKILANDELRRRTAEHVSVLYQAIKFKQMVVIKNYSSPHGQSQKDRIVEPFMLMNGNNEVRCFEPSSKTFKLARMEGVQLLDLRWGHESQHRQMFTDVFMFTDEEQQQVRLRLGLLAHHVLTEEYPRAERYLTHEGGSRWLLDIPVCSFVGIGRFVLGLADDIEVLSPDEFRHYLARKVKNMAEKYGEE